MKAHAKKTPYKRIALVLSLCAVVLWGILGTGASLAWFTDTSEHITNIFHVADFEVTVSHRIGEDKWEDIDGKTDIFDDEALFEPGYVQVVYLKVENTGDREFEFFTAVNVNGCSVATNVFGQQFLLQDYLKFGIVIADTEEEMDAAVADRTKAAAIADMPLHSYDTESAVLYPEEVNYIALVVYMPKSVENEANYRGSDIPRVDLGITVKAEQIKTD